MITLQEIELGVLLKERKGKKQGAFLRKSLDDHVIPAFAGRTLPIDATIAKKCAELNVASLRPYRDSFIAATALVHRMTLVTRDVGDFETMGVMLVSLWEKL